MSSPTTPVPGGRRREALMRQAAEMRQQQQLMASDVDTLRRDRSPEARATVATKFGRQFDELAQGAEANLAEAVLRLLVRDVAREVRMALSQTVAASARLPRVVAQQLAADDIEVARPVLEKSPVLTDEDLIEVVRTNAMQYALAVAGRERLSETVSAALVETGHEQVVVRLIDNAGAKLARNTLQQVLADHRDNDQVQARLVRRPELPHELIEQLVGIVGGKLEWDLVQNRQLSAEDARTLVSTVRERAAIGFTARTHSDRNLHRHLSDRHLAGDLSHEDLLRFLRDGDVASLEVGLALHARIEPSDARRMLYHQDRRHMAALCITAGLSTVHYVMLRMALELAEEAVNQGAGGHRGYSAETMRFLQVQYERLRNDEPKLRHLLGR